MIPPQTIENVLNRAKLTEVIESFTPLTKTGSEYSTQCPKCGKSGKGKGLKVSPAKNIYKCFSCGFSGKNAVSYVMDVKSCDYPTAIKYIAECYNIVIIEEIPQSKAPVKPKQLKNSFAEAQLKASGLTFEDTRATIKEDDDTIRFVNVYESGTRNQYGKITNDGDDLIIWYYDLYGKPLMYQNAGRGKPEQLYRIRWQNPDLHLDKHGRPIKYQSPVGSGTHIYIPQSIRDAFQNRREFKTLFIQEGEKKADAACKNGILSVGIMGIQNLAYNGQLCADFELIIKACNVKEVVFVVDSDWNELSKSLKPGDRADERPLNFFYAVRNFRDYFKRFSNIEIYLDLYFAHVKHEKAKGIDDLIMEISKDQQAILDNENNEIKNDIFHTLNEKSGIGKYFNIYKVSTIPDTKLIELWCLQKAEIFFEKHREQLIKLPEFKINKLLWRFNPEENKIELAQPLMPNETYWTMEEYEMKGRPITRYSFDYENCYNFLRARGYGRVAMADGTFKLALVRNNIVKTVDSYAIKDFVVQVTEEIAPKEVRNMLYRGGKMYLGPDSLSNLKYFSLDFEKPERHSQNLYFKNQVWNITKDGINVLKLGDTNSIIWEDRVINSEVNYINKPLIEIDEFTPDVINQIPENFRNDIIQFQKEKKVPLSVDITEIGTKCHFLMFLLFTSEINHTKFKVKDGVIISDDRSFYEKLDTNLNFVSKITAIGYMLHSYRNRGESKAVIAMDAKNSEIGASNGRSGKSIVGEAIGQMIKQVYISGKNRDLTADRFLFEEVDEKTQNIFIDDTRVNFDFEHFFPFITGRFTIERKAIGKFTLPPASSPKIYICTNHAVNGEGSSYKDRQFVISFSDYYNENHKPVDDFGCLFFDEWDGEQNNLFINFMAFCIQAYLKLGLVAQPVEAIERRRQRQYIGEDFISWADEYFSCDSETKTGVNVGERVKRSDMYESFINTNPALRKFFSSAIFKKKLKKYCEYSNLLFNEHLGGIDDKSNGIEYFTITIKKQKNE